MDGSATVVSARILAERLDAVPGIGPTTAQRRDRRGHEPPSHPRTSGLLGETVPPHHPVRSEEHRGPGRAGQPLAQGGAGRGEAANAAARTDTFLGARYRRIVKRRGHAKALVAVARSILVIAWHLINDPDASYQELGADWHRRHLLDIL